MFDFNAEAQRRRVRRGGLLSLLGVLEFGRWVLQEWGVAERRSPLNHSLPLYTFYMFYTAKPLCALCALCASALKCLNPQIPQSLRNLV